MTFKEFLQLDELEGAFGSVKSHSGPLEFIKAQAKFCKPVRGKGTTISRMMKAGGGVRPPNPPKITSVTGPLTHPTLK